jgi:hypothetical protein
MQGIGYILVLGEKVKVLWRAHKTGIFLKLRKTGKDGQYFSPESEYLSDAPETFKKLKNGQVINL